MQTANKETSVMPKPMRTAPRDGSRIIILTAGAAHNAEWDREFTNFWSFTAGAALDNDAALGWMSEDEWTEFATRKRED